MRRKKISIIGALVLGLVMSGCGSVATRLEPNKLKAGNPAPGTYEFTITASDFNTTSYAANNNSKSSSATCVTDNTKTMDVDWTSNQVMKNGNNMQWQKDKGYIYNTTNLGTVDSVTVTSSAGSFTTYYGTTSNPSSGSKGDGKGYFKTKVGSATGTTSLMTIRFTIAEQTGPVALNNPDPKYDDTNKKVTWTPDDNAEGYQIKVDDAANYSDINTSFYDASVLTANVEHTVYIKAVGDETNYTSAEGHVTFTPTPPFAAKQYVLCTAESDLETDVTYLITTGKTGTVKTMSNAAKDNNRDGVDVTVSDSKITSSNDYLVLKLGGSLGTWNFSTENYAGTNGYLASASSNSNNHLRVISTADDCTITFNANNSANITFSSNDSRNLLRYNNAANNGNVFACYSSGQQPVYLWKEYRLLTGLNVTGTPEKTSYSDTESFDPTGITNYQAVYEDNHVRDILPQYIKWPDLSNEMTTIRGFFKENGVTVYTPTYTISVSSDALSTVSLSGSIVKNYYTDDSWNLGSLAVSANYLSGQQVDVTNDATIVIYSDSAMTSVLEKPGDLGVVSDKTVYIKATYESVSNATGYEQSVTVSIEHGTLDSDPLTADEAIEKGVGLAISNETSKEYYVFGVVSNVIENKLEESNYATFTLVDTNEDVDFKAYHIQPDENCHNYTNLKVGAEVLLKCKILKFNNGVIENGSVGNLLTISFTAPELTGVELDKESVYLKAGENCTLTASPTPIGAELGTVVWSSSNNDVASVTQSGEITAVAEGNATITATTGGFTDTCEVKVSLTGALDLTTDSTSSATATALNWNVPNKFAMKIEKASASTATNNYYPGTPDKGYVVTRAYANSVLTITPDAAKVSGVQVVFEMSSISHATSLAGTTFANATAVASEKNVIVTFVDGAKPISVVIPAKIDFVSVDFLYQSASVKQEVRYSTQTRAGLSYEYLTDGNSFVFDNVTIRFRGFISVDLWNKLKLDSGILGYGVMLSKDSYLNDDTIEDFYNVAFEMTDDVDDAIDATCDQKDIWNYYMPLSQSKTHPAIAEDSQKGDLEGDYYIWNLRKIVAEANFTIDYAAVAYIRTKNGIVFMNEIRTSVQKLADEMIKSDSFDETSLDGSLDYLANL